MMRRNFLHKPLLLLLSSILSISWLAAQGASLYGSAAPAGSAFVRVVNPGQDNPNVWIGSIQFSQLQPVSVSAYRPVVPGVHAVFLGNAQAELIAKAGEYYTVVLDKRQPAIYHDERHNRADLAQLIVYNLHPSKTVALKDSSGSADIILGLGPGQSRATAVNPVAVPLAIFTDPGGRAEIGDIGMARGQSYAILVLDDGGSILTLVRQAIVLNQ